MNRKEYNTAVNSFADRLYGFLYKNLQNQNMANDLVQDTFEKLWVNRKQVSIESVKQWLFTTGYRLMINRVKREQKMETQASFTDFQLANSSENKNPVEQKDLVEHLLSTLTERQKTIVLLRDYEGYKYQEIGEMLGLSESQVKVYLFRARKKLKELVKKTEYLVA